MALKTFYWNPLTDKPLKRGMLSWLKPRRDFVHGNAGDSFNVDLLKWQFPSESIKNEADVGQRILLIGSVAHRVLEGDIVSGIGSKHETVPSAKDVRVTLIGVRGPLTLDAFRRAGHEMKSLRFMGDPGLLIGKVYPELSSITPETGRTIFIPHYRERFQFKTNRDYEVISIDADPLDIAKSICRSEFVYTSSLHGLIWAHALNRLALLVAPRTGEALHKYKDYYQSIDRPFEITDSIENAVRRKKSESPLDIQRYIDQIVLPTKAELTAAGVITD